MNTPPITVTEAVARILTAVANYLDQHATLTHPLGGEVSRCMTDGWLDTALWAAQGTLDRGASQQVRKDAWATARVTLPPAAGTVGEYANQLRAVAA